MLSIRRYDTDTADVRLETKLGAGDYKQFRTMMDHMPNTVYEEESYRFLVPIDQLDRLEREYEPRIAWLESKTSLQGQESSTLPSMTEDNSHLDEMHLEPYPFQRMGIHFLRSQGRGLLADEMGLGKAQPLNAQVLTPTGFREIGSLDIGDEVIAADGTTTTVNGFYPQGVKDLYSVHLTDGGMTYACDEHLFYARPSDSTEWETKPLYAWWGALSTDGMHLPTVRPFNTGEESVEDIYNMANLAAHQIQHEGELVMPIDRMSARARIHLFQDAVLPQMHLESPSLQEPTLWTRHHDLALTTQSLIWAMGGQAVIDRYRHRTTKGYRITYRFDKALTREVEHILYAGKAEAVCISIEHPSSLYITDDFIVTHNTVQALGAGHQLRQQEGIERMLVVCPSSLKFQWQEEIKKFTDHESMVIHGTKAKRLQQIQEFQENPDSPWIAIVNYESIRNDVDMMKRVRYDLIVADEVHRLKNPEAKLTQAMKELKARYRFGLTGTPMANRPDELFSIMDWVDPKILGNWRSFQKNHLVYAKKFNKNVLIGYRNLERLRANVSEYMLRRMKKDVAPDLPEIIFHTHRLEMTSEQQKLVEAIQEQFQELQDAINELYESNAAILDRPESDRRRQEKEKEIKAEEDKVMAFMYLLLATGDAPRLLKEGSSKMAKQFLPLIKKKSESPKIKEVLDIIQDRWSDGGDKIVIFTQFRQMQKLIAEALDAKGIGHADLYGALDSKDRQAAIAQFKYQADTPIFLTTDAGNYGLVI